MNTSIKDWVIEEDEDSCMGAMFIGQDRGDGVIADPICRVTDIDAAKLIAAAPELLEALEMIIDDTNSNLINGDQYYHALNVIAKAKS